MDDSVAQVVFGKERSEDVKRSAVTDGSRLSLSLGIGWLVLYGWRRLGASEDWSETCGSRL